MLNHIKDLLHIIPQDWINLTTHRLDIYQENKAKVQFLEQFEALVKQGQFNEEKLNELPTAYDYIRLGHPLSCVLEWTVANLIHLQANNVISFSSAITPLLAVLRKNLLEQKETLILHTGNMPKAFNADLIRSVYGYNFEIQQIEKSAPVPEFNGSIIYVDQKDQMDEFALHPQIDFFLNIYQKLGSILIIGKQNESYIPEIQHVRRRETIAMTPANTLLALQSLVNQTPIQIHPNNVTGNKSKVVDKIKEISGTNSKALVASSGLSIQYAIMMGLIHYAQNHYEGKAIKFIVPTNCYGGTNDQARRVAACLEHVEVVDLSVDGEHDMVQSIDAVLAQIAEEDAVPFIIAEIPTNPRVEVPDMEQLKAVLSASRKTPAGSEAIDPVFILDQTFCPNIQFLSKGEILSTVRAISYASGSKFPSGGKVTAGYCVANDLCDDLMENIDRHLNLCDNEATDLQYQILAEQLPSMLQRIQGAYLNTRAFVEYIREILPAAKINFVSEELAKDGFTPSVFSLDLPTKGETAAQKEAYKRALNLKLINLMISEIPNESKYCVSYGQLKGSYWTIPATSTQGTTWEGDKDYIVRASLSFDMDLALHKKVFKRFVEEL